MAASPTQKTLAELRKKGYMAAVVEKWNTHARIRQDLYGIIDVLAVMDKVTLGIQATSGGNVNARVKKALESPTLVNWLSGGTRAFSVWGWQKVGEKGKAKHWQYRSVTITLIDDQLDTIEMGWSK